MDVIALRRELHQYPEVGFTEFWTASKVVEVLESIGFDVIYGEDAMDAESRRGVPSNDQLEDAYQRAIQNGANIHIAKKMKGGFTGVIGILYGRQPGPTIAFRFDMDALPVVESSDQDHIPHMKGFRSRFEENMHACCHDGHTAIGLLFASKMANRDFSGTLKLIFQPAEEGGRGACSMVKKGVVDDVNKLYCLHLGLDEPLGTICGGSTDWLASTKLSVHFYGVPSHSGFTPEKGRNALLGAATATLNIHAIPRFSTATTRVNVGILQAGTAPNIVPNLAHMVVETRASSGEVNKELEKRVRDIVIHSAMMHELQYSLEVIGEATTLSCDESLVTTVLEEARRVDGFASFKQYKKAGASEDASFLMQRVQELGGKTTYMVIGTNLSAPHHHHKFDIDEKALPMGVDLLEKIALRELIADR